MKNIFKKSLFIIVASFLASSIWADTKTYTFDDGVALATDWTVTKEEPTGGTGNCVIATTQFTPKSSNFLLFSFLNKSQIRITITSTASFTNISNITFDAISNDNSKPDFTLNIVDDNGNVVQNIYSNYGTKNNFGTGGTNKWGVSNSDISPAVSGHMQLVLYASSSGKYAAIDNIVITTSAPADPVAVTGVTLNKNATTIEIGQTDQLTATVAPADATNQAVTWASSNDGVATVSDNGLVTGVAVGTATITISTVDGNKTATCAVTVTAPSSDPVAVTGVTLNKTSTSIKVGATETLNATIAPSNATNKGLSWSSDAPAIASVNNGVVTGVAEGNATITVTTNDGNFTATCAVTVTPANPVPQTTLTLHEPEIYEAKAAEGGYNTPLVVVANHEYEVFYINRDNSSNITVATSNTDKAGSISDATQSTSNNTISKDGWIRIASNGTGGDGNATASAEFQTSIRSVKMNSSSHVLEMHIKGYDQFSFYGRDNNLDPSKNKMFEVYIDDVKQSRTPSDYTINRFSITPQEHVIRISAIGGSDSKLCSFSLRVAQEPRTKYYKGNDSAQSVLQTQSLRPIIYTTKYNNIAGAETRLVWLGAEATGITLTEKEGALSDTLTVSGTANCPTGTYHYAVVAYLNGVETNRCEGTFKVTSDIRSASDINVDAFQGEEMDPITFRYYALGPGSVQLTWPNGQPAGVNGAGGQGNTYVISGTPTAAVGLYPYEITVAGADTTIRGSINVKELPSGNHPVLFLYKNNGAYNNSVYTYLKSQNWGLIERKAKNDTVNPLREAGQYAKYQWIIISEDVDANNPEALAIIRGGVNLPVLNLKGFTYSAGNKCLGWGEPDNGAIDTMGIKTRGTKIYLQDPSHPIFSHNLFSGKKMGDSIAILSNYTRRGVMPVKVTLPGSLCLATGQTRNINDYYAYGELQTAIHEVLPNSEARNYATGKYICLPLGNDAVLTDYGKALLKGIADYLTSPATPAVQVPVLEIQRLAIKNASGDLVATKMDGSDELLLSMTRAQYTAMDSLKAAETAITLADPTHTHVETATGAPADILDLRYANYMAEKLIVTDYINRRTYTLKIQFSQDIDEVYTEGQWVNIYDIYGRMVGTTNENVHTMSLPRGMYIIVMESGQTFKLMK